MSRNHENWSVPPVDVYENADEFLLLADIPGASDDGLAIELDRGELRLEAKRSGGGFRRRFTVPDGIDGDGVRAELKAGVLAIHLPKAANVKPRKIQVSAA